MVEAIAVAVFGDVAVDQPNLLALDGGIALRDRPLAAAQRLHFGAGELDSRLEPLLDEIVETRAPVLGDDLGLVERGWQRLGHGRVRPDRRGRALRRPPCARRPKARSAAGAARSGSRDGPARAHIWPALATHPR